MWSIEFPSLTWRAQPFAETATNYFRIASSQPFNEALLQPDFVYTPIFPRLISLFVVQTLAAREWYAVLVQYIGLFFVALSVSFVNARTFRSLIVSDPARFILGIGLGLHWGYGMYAFHNLAYWGAPFFLLILFAHDRHLRWSTVALTVPLLATIFPAKAYFIVFVPLFLLHSTASVWRRHFRAALITGVSLIGGIYLALRLSGSSGAAVETTSLERLTLLLRNTFSFYLYSFQHVLVGNVLPTSAAPVATIGISVFLVAAACVALFKRRMEVVMFALTAQCVAIGSILLTVVGYYSTELISGIPAYRDDSHFFFSSIAVFLSSLVLMTSLFPCSARVLPALAVGTTLWMSASFGFIGAKDPFREERNSPSQWRTYSRMTSAPYYYIPVNPDGWSLRKGCYQFKDHVVASQTTPQGTRVLSIVPQHINEVTLLFVELIGEITTPASSITVIALGQDGDVLGVARSVAPPDFTYKLLRFEAPVKGAYSLAIVDERSRPLNNLDLTMRFYGDTERTELLVNGKIEE